MRQTTKAIVSIASIGLIAASYKFGLEAPAAFANAEALAQAQNSGQNTGQSGETPSNPNEPSAAPSTPAKPGTPAKPSAKPTTQPNRTAVQDHRAAQPVLALRQALVHRPGQARPDLVRQVQPIQVRARAQPTRVTLVAEPQPQLQPKSPKPVARFATASEPFRFR